MKLYGSYLSPFSARVFIQLRAKGIDIPIVEPPGGLGSDEYKAINPLGKIPALDTGEFVILESEVICDWIEQAHPLPSLSGDNPRETSEIRQVARIIDIYVMNSMLPLFSQLGADPRDEPLIESVIAQVHQGLVHAEAVLEQSTAVGSQLTLADCIAAPVLLFVNTFLPMFGDEQPLAELPKVTDYWQWLQQQEPVSQVLEEMGKALSQA